MRLRTPQIQRAPPLTATPSQPAHIQYSVTLETNSDATSTTIAQGHHRHGHPGQEGD